MNIKQSILDEVLGFFSSSVFMVTLEGTYDGIDGELVVTFEDDPNTYTVEFTYSGVEYRNFREVLFTACGKAVKTHYTKMGIPSREPFINSVTE